MPIFKIVYRRPYQAIDAQPYTSLIGAINKRNALIKFRTHYPNCEIVKCVLQS